MNPLVGIQGPQTLQQGLMGNVMQPPAGLMGPSPLTSQPGNWSQVAYQMAGSPKQGGLYASVAPPPTLPGSTGSTTSGSGSALSGTLLGILGSLAKNPSLLQNAGSAISSLFGPAAGSASSILAGGSPALSSIGVDGVSELPSATAAVDAGGSGGLMGGATAYGTDAGVAPAAGTAASSSAPAAGGGLLGGAGAAAATSSASALGAGAPGVFATGNAAAGSGTAAAGAAPGLAGTAALVAAPFIAQQLGLMLGDAWTGKNTQGNAAMKGWMQATGAKWNPAATQSNVGQNTFGTTNASGKTMGQGVSTSAGQMVGPNGQAMSPTDVVNAISAWAKQNGVNPGDFHPV